MSKIPTFPFLNTKKEEPAETNASQDIVDEIKDVFDLLTCNISLQKEEFINESEEIIQNENLFSIYDSIPQIQKENILKVSGLNEKEDWKKQIAEVESQISATSSSFKDVELKLKLLKNLKLNAISPEFSVLKTLTSFLPSNKQIEQNNSDGFEDIIKNDIINQIEIEKANYLEQLQTEKERYITAYVNQLQQRWYN